MEKVTKKFIKDLAKNEKVVDLTTVGKKGINEDYIITGCSYGTYGRNGMVLLGTETGLTYVVTARSSAMFEF